MNIIDDFKLQYRTGGIAQQLIFWNVGIAIVLFILEKLAQGFFWSIISNLNLSSEPSQFLFKPWTFITYAFVHANFWHLVFNMIVLNFSSRLFLTYFTQKQFFGLYILGGIFAGLVFVLSYLILKDVSGLVGASGAIMAILMAAATFSPLSEVRLLLIGNVKLWHIAAVILVLDLIQIPVSNTGGHLAHLGGALFGFIYIKLLQNRTDLSKIVSNILDYFVTLFRPKKSTPFKKVHRNDTFSKQSQPKPQKDFTQKQIDEILDKISKSGYDSLTKEEKEFLFKVGKH
ncbi:rhomboid family intramembrane serine protease [Flavobacterium sp.]|uniref:rhomboid family intramembrane serine protease n=1 Tax=Flavobacterium sp. TaxID=239 RepID=UPI0028BD4CD1|nr:rhomboid family intramembrane serine protease [Flavobacterium sp.]